MIEIMKTMVTEPIKRRVRVTAEYEVDITIMPSWFGPMTVEQALEEFRKGLWDVESIDDIAMYAARCAALDGSGIYDGTGELSSDYSSSKANVRYKIVYEDFDSEIIEDDTL